MALSFRPPRCQALVALLMAWPALAEVQVAITPTPPIQGTAPVPLAVTVTGSANPGVTWAVLTPDGGQCDASGRYTPPASRAQFMEVRVRATSVAEPARSAVATLVLLPTEFVWRLVNQVLTGGDAPPSDTAKRKAESGTEGQGAHKRLRTETGAAAATGAAAPETWWKANGNAHSMALPHRCLEPEAGLHPGAKVPAPAPGPFSLARVGQLPVALGKADEELMVGYRQPLELAWELQAGFQPLGQQLFLGRRGAFHKEDVTGRNSVLVAPDQRLSVCFVNALQPSAKEPGVWLAQDFALPVRVRGLIPWVGNAATPPGLEDGRGLEARFQEPLDLAYVTEGRTRLCVATDAGSHALRRIVISAEDGAAIDQVTTPWGRADEPGYRDGTGAEARFRGPTHVACHPRKDQGLVVSDSGNHVIRMVVGDKVSTAAGRPGERGHQDGLRHAARFDDPRGLCVDQDGNVYVADRGNHVIRKITRSGGKVSTLAGTPGQAGIEDGLGGAARFSDLYGLAHWGGRLYAVDGHAVRAVDLATGQVTTFCGKVKEPGFLAQGVLPEQPGPCLRQPRGILALGPFLFVADGGNNCIQRISTVTRRCMTVLGDPGVAEVRWGQCRDGAPGPLPAGGAAVANLRGLAMGPTGLLVAMANCIAEVPCAVDPRVAWPGATLQAPAARTVKVNGPITIGLKLANFVEAGETYGGETGPQAMARQLALPLAMEYTLEFVNADGTLAHAVNGTATGGAVKMLQGWFTRPGKGQVLLRGLTVQGVGVFAEGGPLAFDVVN